MTTNDRQKYEHFYGLIERHKALIEWMCMRRASGDSRRCAELQQECLISIWKHEKQITADLAPVQETLWVYWLCRSAFKRQSLLRRAHLWMPLDDNMSDTIAAPDDGTRDYIESLATVLTSNERRAFDLMAEGYTPDEMARKLGIKPRSAIQLRYRIKVKLRQNFNSDNKKHQQ